MGTQNIHLHKQSHFVLEYFKSDYLERWYRAKTAFLKITLGVWVLNTSIQKHEPFCHGIFQIWLFGEEIQGKTCIFQDNIGLQVIVIQTCTNYHICRISLFPELSDFHFKKYGNSRNLEILEICKSEKCSTFV